MEKANEANPEVTERGHGKGASGPSFSKMVLWRPAPANGQDPPGEPGPGS